MTDLQYRIESVRKDHHREHFDCGHPFLNEYLRQFARQNNNSGIARAFVLVPEAGNPVAGYYTLSAGALAFDDVPEAVRRRLPKYPIPVARIGELAVDASQQGQGLSGLLLVDALKRIAGASQALAVWAVVTDPIDEKAVSFWNHFGFEPLRDDKTMFLTMRDAEAWFQ